MNYVVSYIAVNCKTNAVFGGMSTIANAPNMQAAIDKVKASVAQQTDLVVKQMYIVEVGGLKSQPFMAQEGS